LISPAAQHQRFSVTPTPELAPKPPLNTSLTKILREAQNEEKKVLKPTSKDRRISVDEAQVKAFRQNIL
jgi:hypothetical protein